MAKQHHQAKRRSRPTVPDPPPPQPHEIYDLAVSQAKRRLHSGQEARDGARQDPSKGQDPRPEYQQPNRDTAWLDGVMFVAVLATGAILTTVGHLTVPGLTAVCTALAGLYGAWMKFRPKPPRAPGS
jgi:hypothetical protein